MLTRYNRIINDPEFIRAMSLINECEKDRVFCGHGIGHLTDTARIGYILILENNIPISKDIIYAAAFLHDIGRTSEYKDGTPHNIAGAQLAGDILSRCGYDADEISQITQAILSHRAMTKKSSADADILSDVLHKADKLSRLCCSCSAYELCNWPDNKKNNTIQY
ncbi:MAG: HD domain-containing protein [Oscillospiraceae bacterium]|nr:HD domain-containing protein [Oscillospiraceae bacterium]